MKLYKYQEEILNKVKDKSHVAFYMDMGTGKTFVGSEKMNQLGARVNLLICQKSKIKDWMQHFKENYPGYHIYNMTDKTKAAKRSLEYGFWMNYRYATNIPSVLIINYELAFRRSELLDLYDFTLMLDESSMVQNEAAKRTKFVMKLAEQAKNVILLSGTPTGGKYENLWSQLHMLGWNISKKMYYNNYIIIEYLDAIGRSVPIVKGYKNVNHLKRKMSMYNCVFLKADEILELPEQNFIKVNVDDTKWYRDFHKKSVISWVDDLDSEHRIVELIGSNSLTKMLYERQLASMYNKNKYDAVKDLMNSTDENLIIFYNFKDELAQLKVLCDSMGKKYAVISGDDKSGLEIINYSLNHNFQHRYIPNILLIQYQAGAMGLNLQHYSRRILYFSLPLSSELFEQSKKRIHRIGQKDSCFYYILLATNTIDEQIYKTLLKRQDYTLKLFERGDV